MYIFYLASLSSPTLPQRQGVSNNLVPAITKHSMCIYYSHVKKKKIICSTHQFMPIVLMLTGHCHWQSSTLRASVKMCVAV